MSRILLVDDEPLTTRTLQALIQDEMPEVEVYSVMGVFPRASRMFR